MHKLLVFDLDGTLAPVGKPMKAEHMASLRALEDAGYSLAICSGKPTYYLCGFARQIGLRAPILVGENGGTIQYGVDLPPERFYRCPCSPAALEQLALLRQHFDSDCADMLWYQPNELALTPFPRKAEGFERIAGIIEAHEAELSELQIYPQSDCFDILPRNISKGSALSYLAGLEGLSAADFIVIGDGINDIPMLDFADISIVIGELDYPATQRFEHIGAALEYLLEQTP